MPQWHLNGVAAEGRRYRKMTAQQKGRVPMAANATLSGIDGAAFGTFFNVVRYLDFSFVPSIIVLSSGCRSPIICIITGIERCITSGIF